MKTLKLTSPFTKNHDAESAQTLLTKGKYGDFHPGTIDGTYGEQTAAATRRAKFALGYPTTDINDDFGDLLAGFLSGKKRLPLFYAWRRKKRLAPKPETLAQKALASASTQVGIKENPPNSNNVLYSHWYDMVGPWCAMFVSWNYVAAGSKVFKAGLHYSYCPYILQDAKAGKNALRITSDPQPGDIVLYCWNGTDVPEHTGLFKAWLDSKHSSFSAIEGNTAVGNDANGGEVMERQRDRSLVVAFVQVTG